MAYFLIIIKLLIHSSASFGIWCGIKILHGTWSKSEGLNQEISYSNLPQVISRAFEVI